MSPLASIFAFIFPGCHFCGGNKCIDWQWAATRWVCEDNYSSGCEEDILAQETDLIFGETKDAGNDTRAAPPSSRCAIYRQHSSITRARARAHNSPGTDIFGAPTVRRLAAQVFIYFKQFPSAGPSRPWLMCFFLAGQSEKHSQGTYQLILFLPKTSHSITSTSRKRQRCRTKTR